MGTSAWQLSCDILLKHIYSVTQRGVHLHGDWKLSDNYAMSATVMPEKLGLKR